MKNCWQTFARNSFKIGLRGTDYFESVEGYYLLRHFFGNEYYFWCCPRESFGSSDIDDVANAATQASPSEAPPYLRGLTRGIEADCKDAWEAITLTKKKVTEAKQHNKSAGSLLMPAAGTMTRGNALMKDLKKSPPEESYQMYCNASSPMKR